jgi:hypothetical protein
MTTNKLIEGGISIMDSSEEALIEIVKKSEKELYKEIVKIFENVSITNGKLSSTEKAEQFLLNLDKIIKEAAKKSGYNKGVGKFVKDFDKVANNVKELQSQLNKINITASQIAPIQNIEVANTIETLIGTKFSASVVAPLQQALYRNIMFGATVSDTEEFLKKYILSTDEKESKLLRYVKQVSRDSVSQFDGALNAKVAEEVGLNAVRYSGSLIKDSRSQCRKWVNDEILTLDALFELEIVKAINGLLYYDGKKSSGMYENTNVANFVIYRGGYNCRHRAIPTFKI